MPDSMLYAGTIVLGLLVVLECIRSLTSTLTSADGKEVHTEEEQAEYKAEIKSKLEDMSNMIGQNTILYLYVGLLSMRLLTSIGFVFGAYTSLSGLIQWLPLAVLITDASLVVRSITMGTRFIKTDMVGPSLETSVFSKVFKVLTIIIVGIVISLLLQR